MNSKISPSIIMRVKKFGESDLLVTFFTSDGGRLKGVAKGAGKSRQRFANCLDLFCLANLEYELKGKGDLHFLHSGKLINAFPGLRSDFTSLSLASYMIELTEILFPVGVAGQRMFDLLKDSFLALNKGGRSDILRIYFEVNAMGLGGYGFNFSRCCDCGRPYAGQGRAVFKARKGGIACMKCAREAALSPGLSPDSVNAARFIQANPWTKVEAIQFSEQAIHEIRSVLRLHIEYRLGRKMKSAEYLE
ncbi:MAG: DNA repair protein RecO [Desulfobacterales bacterium]|nr:DNA repair protein RecO [Desulfobacterales bacterium]